MAQLLCVDSKKWRQVQDRELLKCGKYWHGLNQTPRCAEKGRETAWGSLGGWHQIRTASRGLLGGVLSGTAVTMVKSNQIWALSPPSCKIQGLSLDFRSLLFSHYEMVLKPPTSQSWYKTDNSCELPSLRSAPVSVPRVGGSPTSSLQETLLGQYLCFLF